MVDTVPPRGGPPERLVSYGYIDLGDKWSVDLDGGTLFQPDGVGLCQPARGADVLLTRDAHSWVMTAVNGAAISKTNCDSVRFGATPITVNGSDTGDEICVRTDLKNNSHIFVAYQTGVGESKIRLWYVTR